MAYTSRRIHNIRVAPDADLAHPGYQSHDTPQTSTPVESIIRVEEIVPHLATITRTHSTPPTELFVELWSDTVTFEARVLITHAIGILPANTKHDQSYVRAAGKEHLVHICLDGMKTTEAAGTWTISITATQGPLYARVCGNL